MSSGEFINHPNKYFYDPNKLIANPTIADALDFARKMQKGSLVEAHFKIEPGIGFTLPFSIERGGGPGYTSVFNRLHIFMNRDALPALFIRLGASDPFCKIDSCPGCSGCLAPELVLDPTSGGTPNNKAQGLYLVVEQKIIKYDDPDEQRYSTIAEHTWTEGEMRRRGYDDQSTKLMDSPMSTGEMFACTADGFAERLNSGIEFIPYTETDKGFGG